MKAAAYTRVSTSGQIGPDKISLQTQLSDIERWCNYKEWEVIHYEESVASGSSMDRPVLQKLLNDAAEGKFQYVVVADLSRFGRNTLHLKQNIEHLKKHDVVFVSLRENIVTDDTAIGGLIINILASIYEFERETIKIRTTTNKLILWKDKSIFVGHPPFGYKWSKETQSVEVRSKVGKEYTDEAATYIYIVSQYLDFDKSLAAISKDLNDNRVATRRKGNSWFVPVISRMLRHTVYWTGTIITNQGKPVKDQIDYRCEPLISKPRWEAVQARLANNRIRSGRPSKAADVFLLYGQIRCGMCGSKLRSIQEGDHRRYYACYYRKPSSAALEGRKPCILPYIPADEVEKLVWQRLILTLSANVDESKLIDNSQWEAKEARAKHKIKSLEDSLSATKLANERMELVLKRPGQFDPDKFLETVAKYAHEIQQYELEIREATEELNNLQKMREDEAKLIQFAKDRADLLKQVRDVLNSLPFPEKQRFVKGMLSFPVEIGLIAQWDWFEMYPDATEPPENMWKHWSDGLFVSFRFNWPLLQEILSKNLPPSPDGNGNLNPHRGPGRKIRTTPLGWGGGKIALHPRTGERGQGHSVKEVGRGGYLFKCAVETEASQEVLQAGYSGTKPAGPCGPAARPFRTRLPQDTQGRPDDSRPRRTGKTRIQSFAGGDSIPDFGQEAFLVRLSSIHKAHKLENFETECSDHGGRRNGQHPGDDHSSGDSPADGRQPFGRTDSQDCRGDDVGGADRGAEE